MLKNIIKTIKSSSKQSEFGLIIDWNFHKKNKWVCALTPYLVKAIINEFNPVIISNQLDYNLKKRKLKYIISMEPGWAAPKLRYDPQQKHVIGIFISDPHNKTSWLESYINTNNINYVFSYYKEPFFYHFENFPKEKFIHTPWAIPDQFILKNKIISRNNNKNVLTVANIFFITYHL